MQEISFVNHVKAKRTNWILLVILVRRYINVDLTLVLASRTVRLIYLLIISFLHRFINFGLPPPLILILD